MYLWFELKSIHYNSNLPEQITGCFILSATPEISFFRIPKKTENISWNETHLEYVSKNWFNLESLDSYGSFPIQYRDFWNLAGIALKMRHPV